MTKKKYMFTARWCPGCQTMKPIVEKISDVEIIDVDENPELAEKFDIMSLPSYVVDYGGGFRHSTGTKPEKLMEAFYNG